MLWCAPEVAEQVGDGVQPLVESVDVDVQFVGGALHLLMAIDGFPTVADQRAAGSSACRGDPHTPSTRPGPDDVSENTKGFSDRRNDRRRSLVANMRVGRCN